ncbi:MAG TPA: helix-turn-helix transcriptional regulator, partial [Tepidiformaceae bacterium]|nr:helix-turn-helix transcriptional regulator [Tepidiformaceae bacterium]
MTAPAPNPVSMRERLRTDYHWTERQRQVLDLMARGKTNGEIGEALGISLDGAKWHVSEILSKLQAESREEAAEYWRRYNGLAPRFARVFRGIAGVAALRWAAAAVAASAVIGATVAAIAWLSADEDVPGSGDPTPPTTPTPAVSPTPGPSTVPTAGPQGFVDLQQGGDGQLPPGIVVYYYGGRVPIEGPPPDLRRAYRDSNGGLHVEKIYERIPGEGDPYWLALDAGTGRIAVALCLEGYCGGYAVAEPGSRNRLMMSSDGGMTWQDRGSLPVYA